MTPEATIYYNMPNRPPVAEGSIHHPYGPQTRFPHYLAAVDVALRKG